MPCKVSRLFFVITIKYYFRMQCISAMHFPEYRLFKSYFILRFIAYVLIQMLNFAFDDVLQRKAIFELMSTHFSLLYALISFQVFYSIIYLV